MKEIDKIRIRQWNQDNPYIQMKNLENAQPGYRVHTVNDDHHLYELREKSRVNAKKIK